MTSKLELLQGINTIPSKKGRVEVGIKLGLFSPENKLPVSIIPIEKASTLLPKTFLHISPEDLRLPEQIRELSHLPPDFIALIEPIYERQVVDGIRRRCHSPGFKIQVLRRVAQERLKVGVYQFQMNILQEIAQWQINRIENGSAKQMLRLREEVEEHTKFVLNGQQMFVNEIAQEEQIQQSITNFHDGATYASGLMGRGLGEIVFYTVRVSEQIVWLTEYWTGRAVWAAAEATARGVKKAVAHK